jgi:hypothetical protein
MIAAALAVGEPGPDGAARLGRQRPGGAGRPRARVAQRAARGLAEAHVGVGREVAAAVGAVIEGRGEAEGTDDAPGTREPGLARPPLGRRRQCVECADERVVPGGVVLVAAEPEDHLGERRRGREAVEVRADRHARAGHLEGAERLQVAPRLRVVLRLALGEEVQRRAEAPLRPRAPLPSTDTTPCARVASRRMRELSRYGIACRTMASVATRGMRGT